MIFKKTKLELLQEEIEKENRTVSKKTKLELLQEEIEKEKLKIKLGETLKEKIKKTDNVLYDPLDFKIEEKKSIFKPSSWFNQDKTNPMVMIIFSPAGDITIRERVADLRSNLSIGKKTTYRIEHNEIWDIADSDIKGYRGKRVLFYFQDVPNPLKIRRDDSKTKIAVNTETYAKSQKSHLLSELLSPEMAFSDYITMIMGGISIVLSIIIIFKLFFMKG